MYQNVHNLKLKVRELDWDNEWMEKINMKEKINNKQDSRTIGKKITLTEITYVGLFVALISVCSWITIPFAVPFTMQTFAILLVVALLGLKLGTISVCIYIALGALGLPIFSGMTGGMGKLLGMTGGYIIGFIATALITGAILKVWGKKTIVMIISMILGILACYIVGTVWFMFVYSNDVGTIDILTALTMCVFPFIIPDICKIALAITCFKKLHGSNLLKLWETYISLVLLR